MATQATTKNSFTHGGKTIYLNNKELLAEVRLSKERGAMTDTLAKMLMLLCSRYAKKGNFVNYSYNDDMQAYAMMMLVRTWNAFNADKYTNAFAFYTQCIKHSFIQYLKQEQRQRDTRDALMISQGLNPSYGYDDDDGGRRGIEDERDFDTIRAIHDSLERPRMVDGPIERDERGEEIVEEVSLPQEEGDDAEQQP